LSLVSVSVYSLVYMHFVIGVSVVYSLVYMHFVIDVSVCI